MESYVFTQNFDTLEPGVLAGFAPYLRTRIEVPELVAIGTCEGRPVDLACWPLEAFELPGGAAAFRDYWSRSATTGLHLVAISPDRKDGAIAIDRIATNLATARPDLVDAYRCLVVAAGRWSYVADLLDGPGRHHPVAFTEDDAAAVVAAVAVRAGVRRVGEARRLAPITTMEGAEEQRLAAWAEEIRLGRMAIGYHDRTAADVDHYQWCTEIRELPAREAVRLGVAVADNAALRSWLVGRLLDGRDRDEGWLWREVAAYLDGTERATACALAALAAWMRGEDLAAAAAAEALEADSDCALALAVWELTDTGIGAASIDSVGLPAATGTATPVAPRQRA
jgi:hypothetical protein